MPPPPLPHWLASAGAALVAFGGSAGAASAKESSAAPAAAAPDKQAPGASAVEPLTSAGRGGARTEDKVRYNDVVCGLSATSPRSTARHPQICFLVRST